MRRRFLVTGALPYSNGRLHVGHIAGAYLPADIYVRYLRSRGEDVRFICGSDDNGVAALKSAREAGKPVEELTAFYNASQRSAFEGLGIRFDIYGGTHQPAYTALHEKLSQEFFLKIHAKGFFTKKKTRQLYDAQAGMFLPDRFVTGICHYSDCGKPGAYGDQCESCGRSIDPLLLKEPKSVLTGTTPEPRETVHWYLRLDQLSGRLKKWLENKLDRYTGLPHEQRPFYDRPGMEVERTGSWESTTWRPTVLNFALAQIKEGLPERSMTRDLTWGVPVPLDDPDAKGKTLYVWFDAPIGYVSFTAALCAERGEAANAYEQWWKDPACKIVHFIGEDNTIFHALTWPAMLLATHDSASIEGEKGEYQLPWNVVANSFLNIQFPGREEEKISKSRGTAIWIEDYLKTFDPDPLRYYLTAIAPEGQRTAWDFDAFVERNNSELIATLGNFVNRWQKIVTDDFGRKVPAATKMAEIDRAVIAEVDGLVKSVADDLEAFRFKAGLGRLMDGFRACNRYIDTQAPWKSRKTDMELCATTVNTCIQCTKTLGVLLTPFLPFAGEKIRASMGCAEEEWTWTRASERLAEGRALGAAPEILFRRLDIKEFGV